MISARYEKLADWLYEWLLAHEGQLPKLSEIAKLYTPVRVEAYNIHSVLRNLQRGRKIEWRSGTVNLHRGHQAIRIVTTGKILKTPGCPFDPF